MVQIKIEKLCNNCLAKIILQKINARDDDSSTVRKTAQDASIRQPLFFHIKLGHFQKISKILQKSSWSDEFFGFGLRESELRPFEVI